MPHDPFRAAHALARLEVAETHFLDAQEERRQAILDSVRADVPLREVAQVARCSHETIRRIVAADGAVTMEFARHAYPLPGQTVEVLIYKLAGNARGTFARDLERLSAGTGWLAAAGLLADELHGAMADEEGKPVRLDDARAFALHQVLRFTQMNRPSALSGLADSLRNEYGYPPYPEKALRRWSIAGTMSARAGS
ncbi:MAG: hypothetical protein ACTHMY_12840 [Solirubrobacteraceae bacterium]